MQRRRLVISGQVQGVGFRPFVYRLALRHGLAGFVRNDPEGVVIEAQGAVEALDLFTLALKGELPPLARIENFGCEGMEVEAGAEGFSIAKTKAGTAHAVLLSPDVAVCPDCLADMAEPGNRRHKYAFTNCTNCGPRYTITKALPYDRQNTSMACFALCPDCAAEYENPLDRRFHAQPNACPVCGPEVWLVEKGRELGRGIEALRLLAERLCEGKIAAVKGLGGFHLACSAQSEEAVELLRRRKRRPHKPFAVMCAGLEPARRFAHVNREAEALLLGPERPIVLCPILDWSGLADGVSPDTSLVGLMLPYTPLHKILLDLCAQASSELGQALVMTSGNRGGEPIALGNREALANLGDLADCFLLHNRDILIRADDSVVRPLPALAGRKAPAPIFMRRARGYVPSPLPMKALPGQKELPVFLGLGAELKNTLCFSRGEHAFVSQHIGDMHNLETAGFHREIAAHLKSVLQVEPAKAIRDAHPDYLTAGLAREHGCEVLTLQHHFAHAHAVLAEHSIHEPAMVLALDGTGFAPDGTIWGGELLYVHAAAKEQHRLGRFAHLDLPGGEAAILGPWRIAQALLLRLGLADAFKERLPWLPEKEREASFIPIMLERGLNCPQTSSCGRLFDAVAALLGLCGEISYEGQAAIRLENAQGFDQSQALPESFLNSPPPYPCPVEDNSFVLDTPALMRGLILEWQNGLPTRDLARSFHLSLAHGLAGWAAAGAAVRNAKIVGLSGGVLQNATLHQLLVHLLTQKGLSPLVHEKLPPNDACIAYGQCAWARIAAGKRP